MKRLESMFGRRPASLIKNETEEDPDARAMLDAMIVMIVMIAFADDEKLLGKN